MDPISFQKRVSLAPDTLITEIGGESVLLNLKTESYYGLDEVGTSMWTAPTAGGAIADPHAALMDEFEVDAETLQRDLLELVEKLVAQAVIEIND